MKAKQNLSHQIETQMEPVLYAVLDDLLKDLVWLLATVAEARRMAQNVF